MNYNPDAYENNGYDIANGGSGIRGDGGSGMKHENSTGLNLVAPIK
jgi:hypothetical protein